VADFFECEPLGPQRVKGKGEPIHVHRLLGEKPQRSRFQVAVERGLAPFVGREEELALLGHYLERVRRGQGQVVRLR
jgi:hypothetical protein